MLTKKRIVLILAITVIVGIASFAAWSWINTPDPSEPAALVNGTKITFKELQREFKKTRDEYAMQNVFPDKAELKKLKKEILERLIGRELLWQRAVRQDMVVGDEAVSAELEARKKQFGNEAILYNMLKNWNMPLQEFRGLIKRDLTIESLIEWEIGASVAVSETACKEYYKNNLKKFEVPEQVRVSHIATFAYEDDPEEKKQAAEAAIKSVENRLKKGEVFEDLARDASECASSERGGDLGFIARGSMDPEFEKAAFAMKPNKVSSIVRSSMGYHIIKVTDRAPAKVLPFEEVKKSIAQLLREQKIDKGLQDYLAELLKQADVKRLM